LIKGGIRVSLLILTNEIFYCSIRSRIGSHRARCNIEDFVSIIKGIGSVEGRVGELSWLESGIILELG